MKKPIHLLQGFLLLAAGTLAASVAGCRGSGSGGTIGTASGTGGAQSSSSSSSAMAGTTSTGTGGTGTGRGGCAGGTQACQGTPDCPTPPDCTAATCYLGCCGTYNLQAETPCNGSGGLVCSGLGECVACVMGGDCPTPPTLCVTNTCADNACGTINAATGTPCTDGDGGVCDDAGHCVTSL